MKLNDQIKKLWNQNGIFGIKYWVYDVYRPIAEQSEFINMKTDYFRYKKWTIEFNKPFYVWPFCMYVAGIDIHFVIYNII